MKLVFHGRFSDIAGSTEIVLPCPSGVTTLDGLRAWLELSLPSLRDVVKGKNVVTVVNQIVVRDAHHPVGDGDEVAFLPPMSGG